ncbi:MAG TPA: fibronectin type III domain-containing protein [Methylomusa anaerophila]|uniref:Calcineurin-like phosphoesterase n=1 Tax=Methylomusa anaerophila TaxID=1930071 RepID=A0A348ALY0_9FIRM|nr:fibronectin type III domain-containing protein [Methylomusa anaerophila]BBB92078.1 calcineurin-like phosphoesterase [Methylomusa anaerophila]HML87909.1 fibronectin type III domain-containing protein [Methylomusa anaerophila]
MDKKDELLELVQKPGNISRRAFLKTAGSLAVLLSLPVDLRNVFAASPGASVAPDHVTLTWSGDPATTQTITWRTNTTVSNGVIQYSTTTTGRAALTNGVQTVTAALETLKSDLGDANLHSAMVSGLRPGTKYNYRVGDGVNWSSVSSFTTAVAGATSFKFLVFGDSQSGIIGTPEYTPWQNNVHAAYAANTDAKFFINVGDLTECGQNYVHWNNWYAACQDIINTIPAMPSEGNHETYSSNYNSGSPGWIPPSGSTAEPYEYVHQFKVPQNGPAGLNTQAYSWDFGNVHFAIIDSQYDEEVTAELKARFPGTTFLDLQKTWLENDLKNTQKQWKIVIFHKTPYYNKANRTNELLKTAFCPIIEKYNVDVVFNGHDHGISRTYPIKGDVFQNSPSKGTVYYVTGRSGNKYYTDLSKKVWDQFFYDANDMPGYVVAQVNGSSLTLKAVKQNGTVVDTYTINKASGTDSPATVLPAKYAATRVIVYGNDSNVNAVQNGSTRYIPLNFVKVGYTNSYTGGTPVSNLGVTNFTSSTTQAAFTYNQVSYTFTVGSTTVGGSTKTLTSPAILQDGMVMIKADDVTNVLGFAYRYDSSLNAIFLAK